MTTTVEAPAAPSRPEPGPSAPGGAVDAGRAQAYGRWLAVSLAVAFLVRLVFALTDDAPSTDETAYLRSGAAIWEGAGFTREGSPELHFPPGLPFVVGGLGRLVDPHVAMVVLTLVAATLLVLPIATLARRAGGDRAGLAAAFTAALAPGLSALLVNRGGGSEAPYALLVLVALWLVVSARDRSVRGRYAAAAGAAAATGAAYLVRPEGIFFTVVFVPVLATTAIGGWRRLRTREPVPGGVRQALGLAAVFGAVLLVFVAPYVSYLHTETGRWELTAKTQDASIEAWRAVASGDRQSRDRVIYALDDTGFAFSASRSSLPQLAREDPRGYLGILRTNLGELPRNFLVPEVGSRWAWRLLPMPFVLVGLWGSWKYRRDRVILAAAAVAALPLLTSLVFFVLPRYLVLPTALLCVPIGLAFASLRGRWQVPVAVIGVAFMVASLVPELRGPAGWFHPGELTDHRAAGEWIAQNVGPTDRIMTRSMVIEYYADRRAIAVPYATKSEILAFARHFGVRYLVADRYNANRLRPQLLSLFDDVPDKGLRLVREFDTEGRVTRLFALDPVPPQSEEPGPSLGFMGDGAAG